MKFKTMSKVSYDHAEAVLTISGTNVLGKAATATVPIKNRVAFLSGLASVLLAPTDGEIRPSEAIVAQSLTAGPHEMQPGKFDIILGIKADPARLLFRLPLQAPTKQNAEFVSEQLEAVLSLLQSPGRSSLS